MDPQETNRSRNGFNAVVLKTLALLLGIALLLIGLGILADGLLSQRMALRVFFVSREAIGALIALAVGAILVHFGAKRMRLSNAASEETLLQLVQKYEREGKTKELEDAREQLIQLLIEKDEQNSRTRT